jgi:hypothetical protein
MMEADSINLYGKLGLDSKGPGLMNEAGDVGANEEAPNMIHAHQPMGANNSSDSERLSKENNEIVPSSSQMSNSSSDPLRGDIDDSAHRQLSGDFHFQIKMYWEEGFCWQDEWRERKWCWQCEGGNCNEGDKIELRVCSGSSRQRWKYHSAGGGRVRFSPLSRNDLCFEMQSEKRGRLAKCDDNNRDQEFTGFEDSGGEFELFPSGQSDRCLTQEHDPKSYEEVYAEVCRTARGDRTSEWVVYLPSGSPGRGSSPIPQPPTPTSSGSCIFDLNFRDGSFIQDGQRLRSPDDSDLYLIQENDGNLLVQDGERTIWESGVSGSRGDYWTQLQSDGNMISWKGTPKQRDDRVWKTDKTAVSGDYFLGLSCDKKYIGIYKGTPSAPRDSIWTERTGSSSPPSPTPRPPPAGPTPTGSRPRINFKGKDYCTSRNPCSLCEGDCDDDDDCEGSLICKQRDSKENFEGCSGGGSDESASDYCVEP